MFSARRMTRIAVLSAISAILFFYEIPFFAFYKLDLSNVPVMLGGFALGPIAGVIIAAIKSITGLLHSSSAGVGELADFLMSTALILPAALVYRRNTTRKGALYGLLLGTAMIGIVGALVNYYVLIPVYQQFMPIEAILQMASEDMPFTVDSLLKLIIFVTIPFNLIKGGVISLITLLLYKRLSPLLRGIAREGEKGRGK